MTEKTASDVCNRIFATKEEAERQKNDNVVAIIKIEWEE